MPLKVLDALGAGKYEWIQEGIRYAADNGADVINLSLGGPTYSATIHEAIQYAISRGAIVLAAAGNTGAKGITFPASLPEVIAVGAIRFDGKRAYYSNYGPELDLVAPGGDPRVDQNKDGYEDGILQQSFADGSPGTFRYKFQAGTSFAVAHASGVAALIRAYRPSWTIAQVREMLEKSAMDLGPPGWDDETGLGAVNADGALTLTASIAVSAPAPAATPTPASPVPSETDAPPATDSRSAPIAARNVGITDLQVPATVRRGSAVRGTVTVSNAGTVDETVAVGIFDQTAGAWMRTGVLSLPAGQTGKIDLHWNVTGALGSHTIVAYALLPGVTPDIKPEDNRRSVTVEVQRGLLLLKASPSKPVFRLGEPIDLAAQVRDALGPVAGASVSVSIYAARGYRIFSRSVTTGADGAASVRLARYSSLYGSGTCRVVVVITREGYEPLTYSTSFDVK
jgi:hypothetical protein